jgi:hypothetical protein
MEFTKHFGHINIFLEQELFYATDHVVCSLDRSNRFNHFYVVRAQETSCVKGSDTYQSSVVHQVISSNAILANFGVLGSFQTSSSVQSLAYISQEMYVLRESIL